MSKLGTKGKVIFIIILFLIIIFRYFNLSFSLPKYFHEFIEERTETEKFEEIEKIIVGKSSWLENGDLIIPDNGEVIIDDTSEIYDLLNNDVWVYKGGRIFRDIENEYEVYLYFKNGNFQRYHINKSYIISRETSDSENHIFLTVFKDNEIYRYLDNIKN